jgi:RNA polymerase sigma-70 factor, ECF subfamily
MPRARSRRRRSATKSAFRSTHLASRKRRTRAVAAAAGFSPSWAVTSHRVYSFNSRMPADFSDAAALRRSRSDPDAICALYDRHLPHLVAALAWMSGDREVAFDIAQETFARALEHGHRVRLAPDASAWPWLWSVARNLLLDQRRRQLVEASARRRLDITPVAYDANVVDELISRVDARQLRADLARALETLPVEQRRAVIGKVALGLGYGELARLFGTTEHALRARVSRGLRSLRVRMLGGRT